MLRHKITHQGIPDAKYREARRLRREMTPSERLLWSKVRNNQTDGSHFRRQHVIQGFVVDFYCPKAKPVVEVDGEIHKKQAESDRIRDVVLQSLGLSVLRFPNQRVMEDLECVVGEIIDACRTRML
jgi:very-short-patch-repair endonuclease